MDINSLFGLPAHPLIVHAPLVFIPLLAVAIVALVLRPSWRERGGPVLAVCAVSVFGLCMLAAGSGEQLQARVVDTAAVEHHAELGDQLRLISALLAAAIVGWVGAMHLRSRHRLIARAVVPLAALAVVLGGVATVWDVRTGHAGAKAVWKKTADRTPLHAG